MRRKVILQRKRLRRERGKRVGLRLEALPLGCEKEEEDPAAEADVCSVGTAG